MTITVRQQCLHSPDDDEVADDQVADVEYRQEAQCCIVALH